MRYGTAVAADDRTRWNEQHRRSAEPWPVTKFLFELALVLPRSGQALDVAGGGGHNAVWLARRGLDVTLVDISDVAAGRATALAARQGVALRIERRDLESEPLPAGPFALVVCLNYLQRSLFDGWAQVLAPGGLLVFLQPTRKTLERNPKGSARFLLEEGELHGLVRGLEIVRLEESWSATGRHEARLVARRRQSGGGHASKCLLSSAWVSSVVPPGCVRSS